MLFTFCGVINNIRWNNMTFFYVHASAISQFVQTTVFIFAVPNMVFQPIYLSAFQQCLKFWNKLFWLFYRIFRHFYFSLLLLILWVGWYVLQPCCIDSNSHIFIIPCFSEYFIHIVVLMQFFQPICSPTFLWCVCCLQRSLLISCSFYLLCNPYLSQYKLFIMIYK